MWTRDALHELIGTKLRDFQLIVVANREPYIHRRAGKRIECMFPASGMATALDPIWWTGPLVGMPAQPARTRLARRTRSTADGRATPRSRVVRRLTTPAP